MSLADQIGQFHSVVGVDLFEVLSDFVQLCRVDLDQLHQVGNIPGSMRAQL